MLLIRADTRAKLPNLLSCLLIAFFFIIFFLFYFFTIFCGQGCYSQEPDYHRTHQAAVNFVQHITCTAELSKKKMKTFTPTKPGSGCDVFYQTGELMTVTDPDCHAIPHSQSDRSLRKSLFCHCLLCSVFT